MGVRTYPNTRRVYFDMDGVLADYLRKAIELKLPEQYLKTLPGIYETFEILPGAKEAVAYAFELGFDVWALTKPPKENPSAATDKLRWIWRHFPEIGEQVIITPDKGAVGKPGDFLIDDHPHWANANNFGGTVIHFQNDWGVVREALVQAIAFK